MKSIIASAALLALALSAPLAGAAADAPGARVFMLAPQNSSGESGTVVLIPEGQKTTVEVALVGAPEGPQPAHIHEGTCSKLNPVPKYPLTSVENGVSTTTVDVPMSKLTAGGFAVNVHKSPDDLKTYVACGDLGS